MYNLVRLCRQYYDFFNEVDATDDFNKLVEELEKLGDADDTLTFYLKVGELYEKIEIFYRRHRRSIPAPILNNLRADLVDIIEATTTPP